MFLSFCVFDNFFLSNFQENWVFGYSWSTLLWYRCYYPHRSRDALSPVCRMFPSLCLTVHLSLNPTLDDSELGGALGDLKLSMVRWQCQPWSRSQPPSTLRLQSHDIKPAYLHRKNSCYNCYGIKMWGLILAKLQNCHFWELKEELKRPEKNFKELKLSKQSCLILI